ncbi:putative 40S ribosomal protein S4; X [Paratrimastix pyriformis]|uniref:40S ribosomal protein S4 n=1 Tax=Paratrimastix pyriformis TaxID=342808 RepID=A0ABQ8UVP0_9EUKA|nr:putative 40S ribosomal protein S4; X [Paratrimastix pyriformis]
MARGPKKHLKRIAAPKHWMLAKLGGQWAPKPSAGPHKARECLPLVLLIRNRLKYALSGRETQMILGQKAVKVDGVARTDHTFPTGFMDVVSIEKTNEHFRLLHDVKGRYLLHRVTKEEAGYKLGKVSRVWVGLKGIPYCSTHDGRTFRYPHPDIAINDTIRFDLKTKKILDFVKFETGNLVMVSGGRNCGRIGVIVSKEKHPGTYDIVHIRDSAGQTFATRLGYVFVIGKESHPWISLPRNKGVRLDINDDRKLRLEKNKQRIVNKPKSTKKH